jgi:hypothetical protein
MPEFVGKEFFPVLRREEVCPIYAEETVIPFITQIPVVK